MKIHIGSYWQTGKGPKFCGIYRSPKRALLFLSCAWLVFWMGCSPAGEAPVEKSPTLEKAGNLESLIVPEELLDGEARFNTFCGGCHGVYAKGTQKGPPLVHKIYEPGHHGDFAFIRAATQGVRAHHWEFGNMPKIPGVTVEEVKGIIQYVRWLQRQAGVY